MTALAYAVYIPTALEKAYTTAERKCRTVDCWHYSERGYILCTCCLHGRCQTIPPGDYRTEIERALALIAEAV